MTKDITSIYTPRTETQTTTGNTCGVQENIRVLEEDIQQIMGKYW